jgi:PHP family Zn ribbon phosphoesterase
MKRKDTFTIKAWRCPCGTSVLKTLSDKLVEFSGRPHICPPR